MNTRKRHDLCVFKSRCMFCGGEEKKLRVPRCKAAYAPPTDIPQLRNRKPRKPNFKKVSKTRRPSNLKAASKPPVKPRRTRKREPLMSAEMLTMMKSEDPPTANGQGFKAVILREMKRLGRKPTDEFEKAAQAVNLHDSSSDSSAEYNSIYSAMETLNCQDDEEMPLSMSDEAQQFSGSNSPSTKTSRDAYSNTDLSGNFLQNRTSPKTYRCPQTMHHATSNKSTATRPPRSSNRDEGAQIQMSPSDEEWSERLYLEIISGTAQLDNSPDVRQQHVCQKIPFNSSPPTASPNTISPMDVDPSETISPDTSNNEGAQIQMSPSDEEWSARLFLKIISATAQLDNPPDVGQQHADQEIRFNSSPPTTSQNNIWLMDVEPSQIINPGSSGSINLGGFQNNSSPSQTTLVTSNSVEPHLNPPGSSGSINLERSQESPSHSSFATPTNRMDYNQGIGDGLAPYNTNFYGFINGSPVLNYDRRPNGMRHQPIRHLPFTQQSGLSDNGQGDGPSENYGINQSGLTGQGDGPSENYGASSPGELSNDSQTGLRPPENESPEEDNDDTTMIYRNPGFGRPRRPRRQ